MSPKQNNRKTFRIVNLTGGLNTAAEINAFKTVDPNGALGAAFSQVPMEFIDQKNWFPGKRGAVSKAFGFSLYKNTGVASPVTGLYRYIKSDGTNLFLFSQTTKVYKLVAGTITDLGATISSGAYTHFETALDKCVICDGVNAAQTFDGTTIAALTNPPPILRQTLFYQNRLFGFGGTANPSLLYYSDAGTLDNMANNFINCDKNDGQKITSIAKFFIAGQLEPVIIVGKERSVGIVTGDGSASNPYTFSKISFDVGIPGFRQIVQFGQDAGFLTPKGVNTYRTALQNVNIQSQFLSGNILDQFTGLSSTTLPNALCVYDWVRKRIGFAVTTSNNTYNDRWWWYDLELNSWFYQNGFNTTSALVDTDGTLYTADDGGKIYNHSSTVYTYNSAAISSTLTMPYMDFFEPRKLKRIVDANMWVRGNGSYNLDVATSLNFGTYTASPTISIPINAGAYQWNGGSWNSSGSYYWGGSPLLNKKFYPKGVFYNMSLQFTQNDASAPVDIFEMSFEVEYLNQD